jgi:hypothetical protein
VSAARATACHYCPRWVGLVWLSLGLAALVLASACRGSVAPARESAPPAPQAHATITGTVRGLEGTSPFAGRTLAVIDVSTGQRTVVRTSSSGGFSVAVPAGRYRVEMSLHDGETLLTHPDLLDVDQGDRGASVELVVGTREPRPRGPAYRLDNGLGSPIA